MHPGPRGQAQQGSQGSDPIQQPWYDPCSEDTNYSLRKAKRRLRQPIPFESFLKINKEICRSNQDKADAFVHHLANTFVSQNINSDVQLDLSINSDNEPIKHFTLPTTAAKLDNLNPKNAPGFDDV